MDLPAVDELREVTVHAGFADRVDVLEIDVAVTIGSEGATLSSYVDVHEHQVDLAQGRELELLDRFASLSAVSLWQPSSARSSASTS